MLVLDTEDASSIVVNTVQITWKIT
jgi:hypothetical protein